jgi:hypothetical protein
MPQKIRRQPQDPESPYRVGQKNEEGRVICGAKLQHSEDDGQTICQKSPLKNGSGRCRIHGGKSLSGMAHPNYETGRHSRYLPAQLLPTYNEGLNDPKLRELGPELALLDVRIKELTSRVNEGENDQWWAAVGKQWIKFMMAVRTGNTNDQNKILVTLNEVITEGLDENKAWQDIAELVEKRRKLVETEQRRLIATSQMITIEQAMMMMAATIASLKEVVYLYAEPTIAKRIITDAQRKYNTFISLQPVDRSDS